MPRTFLARQNHLKPSTAPFVSGAIIPSLTLLAFTLVILCYLGLVPLGQWQADEYDDFARLAHHGWSSALWERLHWSPRPLSEVLFHAYGLVVNRARQPLIAPFLGILWCGLLVSLVLPNRHLGPRASLASMYGWLAGVGLLAAFLTGGPSFEVFYWPAGAVAYLPTLAITLVLFLWLAQGELPLIQGRRMAAYLSIAALSSEMGAIFVLCFAVLMAGLGVSRFTCRVERRGSQRTAGWLLIPWLLAVFVLTEVRLNRYVAPEPSASIPSPTIGHPLASAAAAAGQLLREIVGITPHAHAWMGLSLRLASEVLIAAGIGICLLATIRRPERFCAPLVAFSSSLLLACFLTLAAAYLHFGTASGERHQTMCRCWILLSLSAFACAALALPRLRPLVHTAISWNVGPVLLLIGVLMVWHVKPLAREYSVYRAVLRTTSQNFASGFSSGAQMLYTNPPHLGVISAATLKPGTYTRANLGPGPDFAAYILNYFEKDSLVVRDH